MTHLLGHVIHGTLEANLHHLLYLLSMLSHGVQNISRNLEKPPKLGLLGLVDGYMQARQR